MIQPVYDATFSSLGNFAQLQQTVNDAVAIYASNVVDNLVLPITFAFSTTIGGAQSSYLTTTYSYDAYRTALANHAGTANDATALANLPTGTNPVVGAAGVQVTDALGLALGLSGVQTTYGTVTFNTGTYSLNPAGFLGVIQHELNEVLGTSSSLPNNTGTATLPTAAIAPADLFRYGSGTARSFDLNTGNDPNNTAFFRLSGTGPNLQQFNNLPNGGDYADWAATGAFGPAPQDWAGSSAVFTSMATSPAELQLLDAVGFNVVPVPEQGTLVSLSSVAFGMLTLRRRKRA